MPHIEAIQIGPCKSFDPSTHHVTTTTFNGDRLVRVVERATRDDLAAARQIAWWQLALAGRGARYGSPRLAHRTGFSSAWSLAEVDGLWVIVLECWELGTKRTPRNTTTVHIPRDADPQGYLDQLDGVSPSSTERRAA